MTAAECPQNRELMILKERTHKEFEEKINKTLKELGSRVSSTKIQIKNGFYNDKSSYTEYIIFIWYYPEKTEEEKEACITKCGCCGALEREVRGTYIRGIFYCYKCLNERLAKDKPIRDMDHVAI
jgi:hypothetical protein